MSTLSIRAPHVPYGRSLPGFARVVSFVEAVLADADRQADGFVPSIGGRSHHISEDTSEQDIILGAQIMLRAIELFVQDSYGVIPPPART